MLDRVDAAGDDRVVRHPAHDRLEVAVDRRPVVRPADHVPARDVEVAVEPDRHRHRCARLGQRPLGGVDRGDPGLLPAGQHDHGIARAEHAGGDLPGVAAVVGVARVRTRPDHPLHREPAVDQVAVRGDVDVLEVVKQRRTLVPGHVLRAVDDVLAVHRRDRDERDVGRLQAGAELAKVLLDLLEAHLRVAGQVHLVDAHDQVPDAEQRGDEGMPARLLDHPLAGVDQDQREVGGRGAGDHVAGVALVAGRVGDDELAVGGLEVAVRDVDRDPLLALGPQPVGQQRQVEPALAVAALGRGAQGLELVGEDLLGVVQQPSDQRALAVVDRARDDQAEHRRRRRLVERRRQGLPCTAGDHAADRTVGHGCASGLDWGVENTFIAVNNTPVPHR